MIEGAWPCKVYPTDFKERGQAILDIVADLRDGHISNTPKAILNSRRFRKGQPLPRLLKSLRSCMKDPKSLNGKDVGYIRLVLARFITKHGKPDSAQCQEEAKFQQSSFTKLLPNSFCEIARKRLEGYSSDNGLGEPELLYVDITADESRQCLLPEGMKFPTVVRNVLDLCKIGTISELLENGYISSPNVLADLLPQVAATKFAFKDPAVLSLYHELHHSFSVRCTVPPFLFCF